MPIVELFNVFLNKFLWQHKQCIYPLKVSWQNVIKLVWSNVWLLFRLAALCAYTYPV